MQEEKYLRVLPKRMKKFLLNSSIEPDAIQEIKLRIGKPLMVMYNNEEIILRELSSNVYIVTESDIKELLEYISNYSLYAYEEEMRQGFITIEGGHRIGLCGQVIVENKRIKNLRYISSVNVRIAREVKGCSKNLISYLIDDGEMCNTLIISPPRCGKTTLLRDIIRQISDGAPYIKGQTVGVVDERSEIGGCYKGVPQNQLGMRTDILDRCPKVEGMLMLIRSMGPNVIAVDEIGTMEDVHAMEYAMHCGCKMLATVHGRSMEEIKNKPVLGKLVQEHKFQRYVVLGNKKGVGSVEGIYDENGRSFSDFRDDNTVGDEKSRTL